MEVGMRATLLLQRDHDELRALFARLHEGNSVAPRLEYFRELAAGLILHAQVEEWFLYPALEETGHAEAEPLISEARFDHGRVEDLIECLLGMNGRDSGFERGMAELERIALQHLREEEARLFPLAERVLAARLDALGRAMEQWRSRFDVAA
jgi:hemerythrin superfamily protein